MVSCFILLMSVISVIAPGRAGAVVQGRDQRFEEMVRSSHIIFLGRVLRPRAVNLKVLQATASTAVVRVDELLDAPPALVGLKGQEVTVELTAPGSVREGQTAIFFTNGIVFGEHLDVKEVGRMTTPADLAALRRDIGAVRAKTEDEKVQARVQSSVLVVTGKVLETKPLAQSGPLSEHDPEWAEAIVEIETIEKGSHDGRTVTVYFPRSTDEHWLLSPKFRPGQQGIFLLHREDTKGFPQGGFFALSPLDFQPLEKGELIRRLAH